MHKELKLMMSIFNEHLFHNDMIHLRHHKVNEKIGKM